MRRGIARAVAIGTVVATCGLGPTPFTAVSYTHLTLPTSDLV